MPLIGMQRVVKAIDQEVLTVNNKVKAIYLQGLNDIKHNTPVDTGTARAGWALTIGTPSSSKQGNAKKLPQFVLDKKIFYTNNYEYINVLEYGGYKGVGDKTAIGDGGKIFSDQVAPSGWVRIAVQKMTNKIKKL